MNINIFLRALGQIESGGKHNAIGRRDERGIYQISFRVWRDRSKLPFVCAFNLGDSRQVALDHLEWLAQRLRDHHIDVTPRNLALAWNSGVDRVISGNNSINSLDYATRLVALYHVYLQSSPQSTASTVQIGNRTRLPVQGGLGHREASVGCSR